MESLRRLFGGGVVDLPLRPLLFTAGAAATAASIYWWIRRRSSDPVCNQATESALVKPSEVHLEWMKEYEREWEAHKILQAEFYALEKTLCHKEMLLKKHEQDQEALIALMCECDMMKENLAHKEESLKVSLADAEEKHCTALKTIDHLEGEKSELTNQVETLRGTVQEMRGLLYEAHRDCNKLKNECERERKAHNNLQKEHDKMKETFLKKEESLKVSLAKAEKKYKKAVESNAKLEAKKSNLTFQMEKTALS